MNRLDAALARLPSIWHTEPGALTHAFVSVVSLLLTTFDQDMDRVQRSHFIDHAFDRVDLVKLGALFDLAPATWEPDHLFRERLKATIEARLAGAVGRQELTRALNRIRDAAAEALDVRLGEPVLTEFPKQRRRSRELLDRRGLLTPLDRLTVVNEGLHPVPLQLVLRGMPGGRSAVPVLINLTTGHALAYAGVVACGQELFCEVGPSGALQARLGAVGVNSRVFTGRSVRAGERWVPVIPDPEPLPITLAVGPNDLWFVSMALYGAPGLDWAMLQAPNPALRQGVFDATRFDQALFHQGPSACLDLYWDEDRSAAFRFDLPAGLVSARAGRGRAQFVDQDHLLALLQDTVSLLRAGGVDGRVRLRPFTTEQRLYDRATVVSPETTAETNPVADALVALGALFDLTAHDGSRFA